MGCTSSAPNMVNSSTAEKSIQSDEEMSDDQSKDTEEIIYRAETDTDNITELPACDTLAEDNVHVVRNRSTPSFKTEKENQEDSAKVSKTDSSATLNEEENPLKLEQLVEKVVVLHSSENINETKTDSSKADQAEQSQNNQEHKDNSNKESNGLQENEEHLDVEQDNHKDDHPEEAISPSQSESSRATRWEALADVAAELPPTLTVDPLTGQIYAVSK
ncbi:hypothetical protein PYW08_013397 [Mythimna loreyi]|uniref:Uncharacterized protein n=1 Tax=Mythimna loreyi TaxID=667449 RepID=A0ACC2QHH3_9NEOP|nr:hypothetical protein PYW08_013397 [Mythimna loreyi]